ncbi:hypothetical protein EJ774_21100 [Pandoraea apista]|uniref:Phage tail protein n=2 Tax=Pandoraea TaxID=93217 RepID=A0ABX9ZLD5_9BURK|nr:MULTISPECIES: hypothetical protein [Pandoraea]RSK77856.1 hypothetical protein EJE83_17865 [Pandoraea apista]RUN81844.1 hypothetical protein EJ774_21100 [Pandoraea apista]VVE87559.1 hypothetical protein PBR20603_01495 [Pandoraea bronchicola]
MLTREQILQARDLGSETVSVPEWGGDVVLGVMSGKARDSLMEAMAEPQKTSRFQALMLASTIVDDNGAQVFTAEDVEQLQGKNPDVLARLVAVAMRINNFGSQSTAAAEKNSEAAPSGSSGSDLPVN